MADAKSKLYNRLMPTTRNPRSPAAPATKNVIVSDESEPLILVDADDVQIGILDKVACHDGDGVLHRAISVFLFNPQGELLLQRRHADKRLWGGFWSNSCCSHPRSGEPTDIAAVRRVHEELGLEAPLQFVFKFEYRAEFGDLGTEHELCAVFVGHTSDEPVVNTTEIAEWKWIAAAELGRCIDEQPDHYTPWLKIEWQRLNAEFAEHLPQAPALGR